MIYRDSKAPADTEDCPSPRGKYGEELCLNCNHSWGYHGGWGCPPGDTRRSFYKIDSNKRYLTQSMFDSVSLGEKKKTVETKSSSRECPCGIARVDCTYHRS